MRSGARRQLLRPLEILREAAPHLLEKARAEDMLTQIGRVLFEYQAQRAEHGKPAPGSRVPSCCSDLTDVTARFKRLLRV